MVAEMLAALAPGVSALGWTLIDSLWQGALVAAGYAAARGAVRSPRARLMAGHVALLLLGALPLLTLLAHLRELGAGASAEPVGSAGALLSSSMTVTAGAPTHDWLLWLVCAWALGVLVLSFRLWREWRHLRWLCAQARPMDVAWQHRFGELCLRLRVRLRIRLLQGEAVATPLLVGVLRPTILLPASLVARMPRDQLELILVHEIAHLQRLDPLFNLLQTAIDTLLFYHPAVHWISRKVREDRELCCDEVVVSSGGDRLRYARALLALAEGEAMPSGTPALAASGGVLLERVERIVERPIGARGHTQAVVVLGLAAVLALVWWVPARERALEAQRLAALPLAVGGLPTPAALVRPALDLVIGDIRARIAMPTLAPTVAAIETTSRAPGATAAVADTLPAPPVAMTRPPRAAEARVPPLAAPTSLPTPIAPVAARDDGADAPAAPVPLQRVAPVYPRTARLAAVQGWVELAFSIDADGRARAVEVVGAEPPRIFDAAARRALERWRYPVWAAGQAVTQRFDFVLPDAPAINGREESQRCLQQTGTRVCRVARSLLTSP